MIDSIPQLDYSPYYVARRKSGWTAFLKEGRDFTIDNQNCYWSIEGAEQLRNLLLYFHHSKCKTSSDLNRQMIEIQDGYKLTESSLASQKISHFDRDYVLWH